jgi:peptide/nickel transport system substrate-binding protein
MVSRRTALALLAAGFVAGCVPAVPSAGGGPTAVPGQPKPGGTLRIGVLGDIQGLDGHLVTGLDYLRRVWDVVSVLDDKLNTVPLLAESVELTPDAKQMTLKLRKGVRFHTGRDLTSEDVVWNFNRLKDPRVNPIYANLVKPFAAMETPDASTVRVTFDAPNPFVVDALPNLSIIDRVSFEQSGLSKAVGTGPYTFVEYVQGDHLTVQKNPDYWMQGKPYLDQLQTRIFTDPQSMIAEFEAGSLDLVVQPTLVDWVRIQKAGTHQALLNTNSGNYMGLAFNTTQPPFNDKRVRQAMQLTLDRQRYSDTVWQGVDKPLTLLWFPSSPAYDAAKNQTYAFSLDKARALLEQAGVAGLTFDFNYSSVMTEFGRMGQIWQADLDKIGVKLALKPAEPVALTAAMQRVQYSGVATSTGFYGQLHGGVVWTSPFFGPVNNFAGFKDDKYTQLTLAVYSEADPSKRKPAYDAWNDFLLDQSPVTAIATQYQRALAKPNLRGATYSIGGNYLDLTGAWLA